MAKIQYYRIGLMAMVYIVVVILTIFTPKSNHEHSLKPISEFSGEEIDTLQINYILKQSEKQLNINLEHSFSLARRALVLSKSVSYHKGMVTSELLMAKYYFQKNDHAKCVKYAFKIVKMAEQVDDYEMQCQSYHLIGMVFLMQDMYEEAQDFFIKSLKLAEEKKDKRLQAVAFIKLGLVYKDKLDYYQAITYFKKSKKLFEDIGIHEGISDCYTELGLIYTAQRNYYYAEESFKKALYNIQEDDPHIPLCYIHLGNIYLNKREVVQALDYYRLAEIAKSAKEDNLSFALSNLCQSIAYSQMKNWDSTIVHAYQAIEAANKVSNKDIVSKSYAHLAQIFYQKGDFKKAFDYQKKVNLLQDSILNENKNWEIGKLQAKFEFASKIEEEEKQLKKEQAQLKERIANHYLLIGTFLPLLFALTFMVTNASVSSTVLKALSFVTIILGFEFILVVLDPYIEEYTGGIPITKLAINSSLALMMAPVHHYLERYLLKRASKRKEKKLEIKHIESQIAV
ncbi:MAG: tetratricopeptide repeat protein [Cytophagales bacterium]